MRQRVERDSLDGGVWIQGSWRVEKQTSPVLVVQGNMAAALKIHDQQLAGPTRLSVPPIRLSVRTKLPCIPNRSPEWAFRRIRHG